MTNHQEFLIDDIMPAREIHLLVGPSGVGKTTLVFQAMQDFQAGRAVWGKTCHPCPLVYVNCDRTAASTLRCLDRLGIPHNAWPWYTAAQIPRGSGTWGRAVDIMEWCAKSHPDARLLIIDGIVSLVENDQSNRYGSVARFLQAIQAACQRLDLTVLGIAHSSKVKEGSKILSPRQQVLGSVAWAGYSELVVNMIPADFEDPRNRARLVQILPKDSAEYVLRVENREGRFRTMEETAEEDSFGIFYAELGKFADGSHVETAQLYAAGRKLAFSESTIKRWIVQACEAGWLTRESRGSYRVSLMARVS